MLLILVFSFNFSQIVFFYKLTRFLLFFNKSAKAMKQKDNCNTTNKSNFTDKNIYNYTSSYTYENFYKKQQLKFNEELKEDTKVFFKGALKSAISAKLINPQISQKDLFSRSIRSASVNLVTN